VNDLEKHQDVRKHYVQSMEVKPLEEHKLEECSPDKKQDEE